MTHQEVTAERVHSIRKMCQERAVAPIVCICVGPREGNPDTADSNCATWMMPNMSIPDLKRLLHQVLAQLES